MKVVRTLEKERPDLFYNLFGDIRFSRFLADCHQTPAYFFSNSNSSLG